MKMKMPNDRPQGCRRCKQWTFRKTHTNTDKLQRKSFGPWTWAQKLTSLVLILAVLRKQFFLFLVLSCPKPPAWAQPSLPPAPRPPWCLMLTGLALHPTTAFDGVEHVHFPLNGTFPFMSCLHAVLPTARPPALPEQGLNKCLPTPSPRTSFSSQPGRNINRNKGIWNLPWWHMS